ncbi:MAG: radical SAM protein [Kofleriaceae bacterium]|nr:radical SAM protein [Kofleriaceae bacterium]
MAAVVATARAEGVAEIVLAGHLGWLRAPDAAARLAAAAGVDAVLVPVVSAVAAVHDRACGEPGALVAALVAMRALAAAGVAIEVEVPVIAARLQDLPAVLELATRAVPTLRALRLVVPRGTRWPRRWRRRRSTSWARASPPRSRAGHRARHRRAAAGDRRRPVLRGGGAPAAAARCASIRGAPPPSPGCAPVAACARCAVAAQCPGVPASYARAHGDRQVRPLAERPRALYEQRTTPRRRWDDAARAAARQVGLLVLRPTVHCNQDCTFCSANESTPNVWADPARMRREIARAARRGLERVSFSGGEPTLARELPGYVAIARRSGVRKIELVTNGVLLDRRARVDELARAGLTHAFVSLHGHDELVSRAVTRKEGDFARTMAAIGHLVDAGVLTVINHVVNARNARMLTRFVEVVHARFGGRVMISFAFVTPQYKALENIEIVPRLSEVRPHLQAAAWRALALGQPFVVGSRQGVPPCQLGPFEAWSDLLQLAHEAQAEDAPQKVQGPRCGACRYARYCTGVWRPYAARFGTDELEPVPGAPIGPAERDALLAHARRPPWGQPMSFDQVAPLWRRPDLEAAGPPVITDDAAPAPARILATTRPVRLLMIGSGRRARQLARAAAAAGGLAVTGVCSPHVDHAERGAFDGCPTFTDLAEALDRTRPDAVVIAAATPAHVATATAAIDAGVPVLIEKPVATTEAEAAALVAHAAARGVALMPAHNDRFAAGLEAFAAEAAGHDVTITRRSPAGAPDVPLAWSRPALYESLYHLVVLAHRVGGDELTVAHVQHAGDDRLGRLRAELTAPGGATVTIAWEVGATDDALIVTAAGRDAVAPARHWRRVGRDVAVDRGDGAPRARTPRGSDAALMLAAFRDAIRADGPAPVAAGDAVAVMRLTRLILDAMAAAGAPFVRPGSPRHASSRSLSRRYS